MLIVLGILSILLGLLYGSLERTRKFSRYTIAYNELKQIQAAFEQYYAHYGVWPTATNNPSISTFFTSENGDDEGFVITSEAAKALQGVNDGKSSDLFFNLNPDGIPFIEFTRYEAGPDGRDIPVNPFKASSAGDETKRFKVLFDTNGDRQIAIPIDPDAPDSTNVTVIASVAVWTIVPGARTGRTETDSQRPATNIRLGSWDTFDLKR